MPVSIEKTYYPVRQLIFLGILICTESQTVSIPRKKVEVAKEMLEFTLAAKKVTVLHLHKLTGLLNFFGRAIILGRAFTRCFYAKFANPKLKQHHHVRVDRELKADSKMWLDFLGNQ